MVVVKELTETRKGACLLYGVNFSD